MGSRSLGAKLIAFSTLLTIVAVALTCAALSVEIRRQTRRLLADTLDHHQRMMLDVQRREHEELLWLSRLMTESPTLRAAMETYESEGGAVARPRADLLATIQTEAERIAGGLDHDVLIITDTRGKVLARSGRLAPLVRDGVRLMEAPVVRAALDPEGPIDPGGFAILEVGDQALQIGCVPIVLQGFTIGSLVVGDALGPDRVHHLHESLDAEIVITLGDRVLASTLPGDGGGAAALAALPAADLKGTRSTVRAFGGDEYVATALPLGTDAAGHAATLHLLHSLTQALAASSRALLMACLLYGALAAGLAGGLAWAVSRSVLAPLESFVAFLRGVAASGDHARRFNEPVASLEVRTLNETYGELMDSLQEHEKRLVQRAREDLERMERLQESEKLAALGRMLSGAAHEINNPLTGVLGNIDLLLGEPRLEPLMRTRLERVRKEGQRIVALVRNLLKTAHRDAGARGMVDLNAVVRECVELRRHDFTTAGLRLRLELTEAKCRVLGNELELQQVFLNIINNAHDALREIQGEPELVVRTGVAGAQVRVEFSDNGPGLKEPQRVFEHFYTTKEVGKGTGLGLSISHAIVQHHGGRIAADNREEGGARFVITLPALEHEVAPAETTRPVPAAPSRAPDALAATVLVVDDEPSVLDLQLVILESVGARARGVNSGAQAIAAIKESDFDLIISDLKMPGEVSGQDLYRWVEANRPEAARGFVFVTGDTLAEATQAFLDRTRRRYVQKPFGIDHYLATLRETLDERKAA